MGSFLAWMDLAEVFRKDTFKGGREGRRVRVCRGGQYLLYTLSAQKKLSTDLAGFHHTGLIQGCSKSATRRKSGRLAGTWKVFKGDGGVGASRRGWGWGWSAQPVAGEAPFHGFGHLGWVLIFMLSGYPNYSPHPLPGRWEQMCPAIETLAS